MKILDPGLLTTVQDLGRSGYQKDGITPGGAMDTVALRAANSLVCNEESAAALEITLKGPAVEFERDCLIAICGGDLSLRIADIEVPSWRAIFVQAGSVLNFGEVRSGCRAYLSISGGITVPEVMGSRSTYLRAGIGGIEGRPLRAGDTLPTVGPQPAAHKVMVEAAGNLGPLPFALSDRRLSRDDVVALYEPGRAVHVLRGPHFGMFDERDRKAFLNEAFEVSPRSDRMGYRLTGPLLDASERDELISSAVLTGSVQVPPGGEPIVLMVDRQTTGGYPIIGQVAAADLPLVAQLKPGDEVRFEEVTIDQAQSALRVQSRRLRAFQERS